MDDFLRHVPDDFQAPLTRVIEAITESKVMLDEVAQRYGTTDPEELRERVGEVCDGIEISEETVGALEALHEMHEQRRELCRRLMDDANAGRAPSVAPEEL